MAINDFPRYPLTFGPSPVHPLERLSRHLGGAQVWAKREDCNSGLAFGGNKTRKLEYIVPDALAQGADTLVSIGGIQSNHTRQVAAVAARAGPEVPPGPGEVGRLGRPGQRQGRQHPAVADHGRRRPARPLRLRHRHPQLVGGGDARGRGGRRQALRHPGRRLRAQARRPRASPTGPTRSPSRRRQLGVFFDTIVVCTVTGSTHAGMIAGFAALEDAGGRPRRVIGIDASATIDKTRDQVARIARNTAAAHRPRARPARRRDHRAGGLGR